MIWGCYLLVRYYREWVSLRQAHDRALITAAPGEHPNLWASLNETDEVGGGTLAISSPVKPGQRSGHPEGEAGEGEQQQAAHAAEQLDSPAAAEASETPNLAPPASEGAVVLALGDDGTLPGPPAEELASLYLPPDMWTAGRYSVLVVGQSGERFVHRWEGWG